MKLKYPKLLFLIFTFVIAYLIFAGRDFQPFHKLLFSWGYFGTLLAGIFFSFGFTAAPATAILLILAKQQNIFLAGFIAGFGALIGDLVLFNFIRHYFTDEIKKLHNKKVITHLNNIIPAGIKKYFILVLAGFIIASPLPDEIGISLLAASRSISIAFLSALSYSLNTAGIFVILLIGNAL